MVLIELDGGNDGLNTVVPYTSKNYYSLRPTLALKKDEVNILDKKYALNKSMKNVYKEFQDGNVAIINGLGYEKPNLSHFKSIKIVETAGTGKRLGNNGWLSSYLKTLELSDQKPAHAMLIGKRKKGYLFSNDLTVVQVKNINSFIKMSKKMNKSSKSRNINENISYLFEQEQSIFNISKSLDKNLKSIHLKTEFPEDELSQDFSRSSKKS